jgi:hypothetical protein
MATFLYGATLAFLAVIAFIILENKVKGKES